MLKSLRTNTLADGLIERTSSMLDEIKEKQKLWIKKKKMIDSGKRSETMSEIKLVENISKNSQKFALKDLF